MSNDPATLPTRERRDVLRGISAMSGWVAVTREEITQFLDAANRAEAAEALLTEAGRFLMEPANDEATVMRCVHCGSTDGECETACFVGRIIAFLGGTPAPPPQPSAPAHEER